MAAEVAPDSPSLSVTRVIVLPISTFSVMYFSYGYYVYLFGRCIHMLAPRRTKNRRLYLFLTSMLFLNSTFMVIATTIHHVRISISSFSVIKAQGWQLDSSDDKFGMFLRVFKNLLPTLGSAAADAMLIHRCYLIWGYQKRVAIPLIVATMLTIVINLVGTGMQLSPGGNLNYQTDAERVALAGEVTSAAVNLILTSLTAGRIWWLTRQARVMRGRVLRFRWSDPIIYIVRIILESGLLLPITILIHLGVALSYASPARVPVDLLPLVVLVEGIAPTLIIVRAKKAISRPMVDIPSLPNIASTMRFTIPTSHNNTEGDQDHEQAQTDVNLQQSQFEFSLEVLATSKDGKV